jgi:hypothetical protein
MRYYHEQTRNPDSLSLDQLHFQLNRRFVLPFLQILLCDYWCVVATLPSSFLSMIFWSNMQALLSLALDLLILLFVLSAEHHISGERRFNCFPCSSCALSLFSKFARYRCF